MSNTKDFLSLPASPDNTAIGAEVAAVITYPATAGVVHGITGIAWSYNPAPGPAAGSIKIEDGADTVFQLDLSSDAPQYIPIPLENAEPNTLLKITLGGIVGSTGKVNALGHYTRAVS